MRIRIVRHWPLLVSLLALWLTVLALAVLSIRGNQGHLAYALDDAYIHMAMAKNLAQHGVWGVTRYEFSSSSSSLLWTLMLAGIYFVTGPLEVVPLILNILLATLVVVATYALLRRYAVGSRFSLVVLLAVVFFTPLPTLVFTGMERVLQTLVVMLFSCVAAGELTRDSTARRSAWMWILAPVVTATRYEGLFVVSIVCVLLLLRRRCVEGLLLGALAVAPLGVYGMISVAHGWSWLPNSIRVKGNMPPVVSYLSGGGILSFDFAKAAFASFGQTAYRQLFASRHLLSRLWRLWFCGCSSPPNDSRQSSGGARCWRSGSAQRCCTCSSLPSAGSSAMRRT